MRALHAALAFVLLAAPLAAGTLDGPARVTGAAHLEVAGQVLRLAGIAAPPPGTACRLRGAVRDCGALAATQLRDLTFGARVVCTPLGPAATGAAPARCTAGGYDLAEGMVHSGWARAAPGAPARLQAIEAAAHAAGRGLWRDGFPVLPASSD